MTLNAGEILTAGRAMRLQTVTYDAAATASLTLTTTLTDITGASIGVVTVAANAVFKATAHFDMNVATSQAGQLAEGHLDVDGVDQSERGLKGTTVVDRATVAQQWRGTLVTAGAHTLKLRGVKSGTTNVASIVLTHTTLTVEIFEVV